MENSITHFSTVELTPKDSKRNHWLFRYGLSIAVYATIVGLSLLLSYLGIKLNFTIPVFAALVVAIWYGGRGPGILLAVLFEITTIYFTPIPPDSTAAKAAFGYFSVFVLYLFFIWMISRLKDSQHRLRSHRDLLQVTLSSIGDAVVATDTEGKITFMNPPAQTLTGWNYLAAEGRQLSDVISIINEETREKVANPVEKVLASGSVVGLANHSLLVTKDGREIPIEDSAAPIKHNDVVKGVVLVFSDVSQRKLAERSRRDTEIMHRLVEAQEAERHRIARDLHDHLGQRMTALRLRIQSLNDECAENPSLSKAITEVQESAQSIDRDIGFLSWELRPTELENFGLVNALSSFVRAWSTQHGIAAEFHAYTAAFNYEEKRLPELVETNLYRITQEALNNIRKHADARNVNVLLQVKEQVTLIIEDDGLGFDRSGEWSNSSAPGGLGLISMQERAALLKGDLEVDSSRGGGTTVRARIPLSQVDFDKARERFERSES
ncbi:MAG: PAS domain S-box protein [Pyrinomonadaceae bacterium]